MLVGLVGLLIALDLLLLWPGWAWNWNPRIIEKKVEVTRVVEKPVEKVVKETVIKEVTKIVEKPIVKVVTIVVEKRVEVERRVAHAANNPSEKAPVLFDGQSTGKEYRATYDIGIKDGQVGILFGYGIVWKENASGGEGCGLVWLKPGWYENLAITDGRYEIYDLPEDDQEDWIKVLVEQRAAEQASDYQCPEKESDEVPVWDSSAPSPPSSVTSPTPQPEPTATPEPACERQTSGENKELSFEAGAEVWGWKIVLDNGESCDGGQCYVEEAPSAGKVTSGVVCPWEDEPPMDEVKKYPWN